MLQSEVAWFPVFLQLCQGKKSHISKSWTREENPLIPLLECIRTCHIFHYVVRILRRHHWVTRQAIYALRTEARLNTYYPECHEPWITTLDIKYNHETSSSISISYTVESDNSRSLGMP